MAAARVEAGTGAGGAGTEACRAYASIFIQGAIVPAGLRVNSKGPAVCVTIRRFSRSGRRLI